jgi:hypothetical protein
MDFVGRKNVNEALRQSINPMKPDPLTIISYTKKIMKDASNTWK